MPQAGSSSAAPAEGIIPGSSETAQRDLMLRGSPYSEPSAAGDASHDAGDFIKEFPQAVEWLSLYLQRRRAAANGRAGRVTIDLPDKQGKIIAVWDGAAPTADGGDGSDAATGGAGVDSSRQERQRSAEFREHEAELARKAGVDRRSVATLDAGKYVNDDVMNYSVR
jgi:hypothetical protein